jgi:hypothetical protein
MTSLIVDRRLSQELQKAEDCLEIYDDTGKILGLFTPCRHTLSEIYERAKSAVTDEELEAAAAEPGGRELTEFWRQHEAQS